MLLILSRFETCSVISDFTFRWRLLWFSRCNFQFADCFGVLL